MDTTNFTDTIKNIFKKRRRRTLYFAAFLILALLAVRVTSERMLITVPSDGGSFSEAIVGYPRFVNPVLALSQTDRDISQLVFSGLLSQKMDGTYENDIAANYAINEDATIHTITLKSDVLFHDKSVLDADDVIFTYELIQDPLIKSPLFPRINNVEITKVDDLTVSFTLEEGDKNFQKNLTVGILSQEQWSDILKEEFPFAQQNISPIGTGPYLIDSVVRDRQQRISSYVFTAFRTDYSNPHIDTIELKFFENQELALQAFESGRVANLANISAQELLLLDHTLEQKNIKTSPLPRIFSLFLNQETTDIFGNEVVRKYLTNVINPTEIKDQVFFSRATVADGPLVPSDTYYTPKETINVALSEAVASLEEAGWAKNESGLYANGSSTLEFSLHVPDVTELVKSAEVIKQQLLNNGVNVEIIPVDETAIIDSVIRRREFESLLYGQIVSTPEQLFAFWHSSGAEDPGVNIAGYENKTVDAILERIILPENNNKNEQDYANFQKEIRNQAPVVFLFSPQFIYAIDKSIQNNSLDDLEFATDRFKHIESWYINTELLLPFFI